MKKKLYFKPVRPTVEVMKMLENKGLIYRLCPGHDELNPPAGEIDYKELYVSDEKYGPHRIITVTINRFSFSEFGTHSDNEEFLIIGDTNVKPLYLLVALMNKEDFNKKIENGTLSEEDFILLDLEYNNPETSFFIMNKNIPHGEATVEGNIKAPSFYVTESRGLDLIKTDFKDFEISIL